MVTVRHKVWTGWTAVLAVTGLLLMLVGTLWLVGERTRGAELASVLGLPLTLVGTAITVLGWVRRPAAADPAVLRAAAGALARQVSAAEATARQRLLGDNGDLRAADVGFAQPGAAPVHWRTDGGAAAGSVQAIAGYYRSLARGRLVVLGAGGAGKTVLASQLAIDLADGVPASPVPVRMSLPTFPAGRLTELAPERVRDRLDAWLAAHLVTTYGLRRPVAAELVAQGWVLPILDGLDEMDPDGVDPVRARAVLTALNVPALRPVVVTSRDTRYAELCTDRAGVLQDATVVCLRPLTVEQSTAWLAERFPDPAQPRGLQKRWQPVATRMARHPGGALARALASPLRLYLAVTTYQDPDTTPAELCTVPAGELDDHLFTRLVPTLTRHVPRASGRRYDADGVTTWLRTFARHLSRLAAEGRSGTDIELHELWRSVGHQACPGRNVRQLAAVLYAGAAVAGLLVLVTVEGVAAATSDYPYIWLLGMETSGIPLGGGLGLRPNVVTDQSAIVVVVGLCVVAGFLAGVERRQLRRLDLGLLATRHGRRRLAVAAGLGLVGTVLVGLLDHVTVGVATALHPYGLVEENEVLVSDVTAWAYLVLPLALLFGLQSRPETVARPSTVVRQGLAHQVLVIGVVAFIVGSQVGPDLGVTVGLPVGAVLTALSPWPRYGLVVLTSRLAGRLPARPALFLDWADTAGLVRQSGIAVQFRHRDFQRWLERPESARPPKLDDRADIPV
jgi:hypothetical protein